METIITTIIFLIFLAAILLYAYHYPEGVKILGMPAEIFFNKKKKPTDNNKK